MLIDLVKKGSTDRSILLRIIDSTDGTPETGVVFNTSGIDLWYRREGAAVTSITEVTLAALTTAHTDGGFLAVSHGYYRLDIPDAAFATGANYVDFGGTVTGMVVIGGRVRLTDFDVEVTNIPVNVAQFGGTNGTFSAGRPEVNTTHVAGTSQTAGDIIGDTNDIQTRLPAALVSGRIDASVGAMANNVMTAAAANADLTTELQSGLATAAALATVDGIVDDILLDTAEIGAAGAGLTVLATAANLATVDTVVDTILVDTNELQTDWVDGGRLDLILDARASQTSVNTLDDFVDTEVAAILAAVDTEIATLVTAVTSTGVVISTATQNSIRDAIFARAFSAAYSAYTFDELIKLMSSVLLGKASGLATTNAIYRNLADTANVIDATVDADGNRTVVTRTP